MTSECLGENNGANEYISGSGLVAKHNVAFAFCIHTSNFTLFFKFFSPTFHLGRNCLLSLCLVSGFFCVEKRALKNLL